VGLILSQEASGGVFVIFAYKGPYLQFQTPDNYENRKHVKIFVLHHPINFQVKIIGAKVMQLIV